jgi:AcrR family transcriptional regulator
MSRKPAVPGIDRRQQMLEAALEIFAEQGFEAATNKAIADRAGVNQGLIYFYFTSKADVYFATFAFHTEQVRAQLDVVFAQEGDTRPEDGFTRLLKGIVLVLSAPPAIHLLRIMYQITGRRAPQGELSNEQERQTIASLAKHLAQRLREYLEAQMSRGGFITLNPGMVSYLITRTLIATVGGRGHNDRAHPDFDLLAETMARLYCYGLLPREEKAASE